MAGNPSPDGGHSSLDVRSMCLGLPPAPALPQGLLSLLARESQVSVMPHTVIPPPGLNRDLTVVVFIAQGYACHAGG